MAGISGTLTQALVSKLTSTSEGVNIRIGAITQGDATLAAVAVKAVMAQNVSVDVSDHTGHTQYPSILVYCDKLSNAMTEKFREFSGHARMNAEVRHSEDRLDRVQTNLQTTVDAVCALLADSRGDWGNGAFYTGGYDVTYEPVVRGGKEFLAEGEGDLRTGGQQVDMAYISSNANRWYCAKETSYGLVPAIGAANRIPAVKLSTQQQVAKSQRKDKTGSRTWAGNPTGMRRQTTFNLTSYMRDWPSGTGLPAYGPLFEAAMGAAGMYWAGANAGIGSTTSNIRFASAHGLAPGQAISSGAEIRFVAAVADPMTVVLNAPFSMAPTAGAPLGPTATYGLGSELPSVSLFDYWDPVTAVQRVLAGAAMNTLSVKLNGDFQELQFGGMAQDIMDSASFQTGEGGLNAFPAEPTLSSFSYSPVPGNLGQVWLGVLPTAFLTVSSASIDLNNNVNMRLNEFGSTLPRGIAPGAREVTMTLELFGQDDEATTGLYQAARQLSPLSVMFQTGQASTQMMGVYVKSIIPDLPQFDDTDQRLKWKFSSARAQGTTNDELVVAFA